MNSKPSLNPWKRLLINVLVYNILNGIVVFGVGWYFKWTTLFQYGGGLFIGGIILVGFGVLGLFGYWGSSRSGHYLIARSVSSESSGDRNLQETNESMKQYSFIIQSTVAGIVSIVIGSVMQTWG
jgi:hypothetical protein